MHRVAFAVVVAAVAAAGCLEPGPGTGTGNTSIEVVSSGTVDDTRDEGELWVVRVHGDVQRDPAPGYACDVAFDHRINPEARTLEYSRDKYAFDPANLSVLVALDVFESRSDCPKDYRLAPDPEGAVAARVGANETVAFTVREDGAIAFEDGPEVEVGEAAVVTMNGTGEDASGDYTFASTIRVENLGAWDHEGIRASR